MCQSTGFAWDHGDYAAEIDTNYLGLAGPGTFSANGYEGQHIVICPDRDLIIVRNGATPEANQPLVQTWLADLAGLFA